MCWGFQVQGFSFKVVRIRESPLVKVFGVGDLDGSQIQA